MPCLVMQIEFTAKSYDALSRYPAIVNVALLAYRSRRWREIENNEAAECEREGERENNAETGDTWDSISTIK